MSAAELVVREHSAVDAALALAEMPRRSEGLEKKLDALTRTRHTLLPVEAKALAAIDEKIDEAKRDLAHAAMQFPRLSLEVLGWRWPNGMPKLAILPLDTPTFAIRASRERWGTVSSYIQFFGGKSQIPYLLASYYQDVKSLAESYCFRRSSKRIYSFTFDGVIPLETKRRIADLLKKETFKENEIYLLVEAPPKSWAVEYSKGITGRQAIRQAVREFQLDPLVVGFRHSALWLLDKFDVTTLEEYVADEFSAKALGAGE